MLDLTTKGEMWELDPKNLQLRKKGFLRDAQKKQNQLARKRARLKATRTTLQYQQDDINEILDWVEDNYARCREYEGTIFMSVPSPALFWPDGNSMDIGSSSTDLAEQFNSTFRYWGFEDFTEFYSIPMKYRNAYLAAAIEFWEELFGSDGAKIKLLLRMYNQNELDIEDLLAICKDKECTLRAGYSLIYDLIIDEAIRCEGWERVGPRKRGEANFRRPFPNSSITEDPEL